MNGTSSEYCSPIATKNIKNGSCFSKESLLNLIKSWNDTNKNDIIVFKPNYSIKKLWNLLNDKLIKFCNNGDDICWINTIKKNTNNTIKHVIADIENKELKPIKPIEWTKNPHEWLSNYDIENVMKQYESNKDFKYKFLGVFPIDFAVKDKFGKCLFTEFCGINIKKYIKNRIKFIGLITNLDKHDEPGSHWTSTFFVIDPKLQSYGVYYYDSTARNIPSYILNFLKDFQKQITEIYPNTKFNIFYNKKQHQKSNTECGVFSITYQIRWLEKLKNNKDTGFNDIIGADDINDNLMYKMRNILYRPPT